VRATVTWPYPPDLFRGTSLSCRDGYTAVQEPRSRSTEDAMKALVAILIPVFTFPVLATAQPADHLKCYKVRDPQAPASYTADLGGVIAEPGCTIKVPATMACVPATKTNVQPPPPGGGATGTPNAFGCYKIKCPKATLPPIPLNDQFGSRSVTPSVPKLLCAPVATTTTTTLPCSVLGAPCGTCGTGTCKENCGPGPTLECTAQDTGIQCTSDFDCATPGAPVCASTTENGCPTNAFCHPQCP